MAEIRTNGKAVDIAECIKDHRTSIYGIPAILWNVVNWQQPEFISHYVQITAKYFKQTFEVKRRSDDGGEFEVMLAYERRVENGKLIEMLAPQSIIGLVDVKIYKETPWSESFASDTYFFGRNLIESWGKTEEIAKWVQTQI
jgi:hypothetical protein